jgi:hypothetical protein
VIPDSTGADKTLLEQSLLARWTDSSNYLRFSFPGQGAAGTVKLDQVVAAAVTTLASATFTRAQGSVVYRMRLIAYATGRTIAQLLSDAGVVLLQLDATSSALATGGTLASGKPGLRDQNKTAAVNAQRLYTQVAVTTPPAEQIALYSGKSMQVRYDDTLRQDSTATYYGRPPSYRGSRFLLPPALASAREGAAQRHRTRPSTIRSRTRRRSRWVGRRAGSQCPASGSRQHRPVSRDPGQRA